MKKIFSTILILGMLLMGGCSTNESGSISNNNAVKINEEETFNDQSEEDAVTESGDIEDKNKVQESTEVSNLPSDSANYLSVGDKLTIEDANGEVIVWETVLKNYEVIKAADPDKYIVMLYFDHNYLALDETGNLSKANPLNISATFNNKELIEQTEINAATNKFENEEDYIYYYNDDQTIQTCSRSFIIAGENTSCYTYFKYEGDGEYIIHFNDGKDGSIDYLIKVQR